MWCFLMVLVQLWIVKPAHQSFIPAVNQIYQFPNLTWVENIAVRSNGQLLVTQLSSSNIWQIDPIDPSNSKIIAQIPSASSTLGIQEIDEDVFVVNTGNFSIASQEVIPNSFAVWKLDMQGKDTAAISKIVDMPEAGLLNGLCVVETGSRYLLTADSSLGVVWRVDMSTSTYHVLLNDTTMQPARGQLGIDGIHTRNGYLYFTNLASGFFRVSINQDGTQRDVIQTLASLANMDDFAFDAYGRAYLARGAVDQIVEHTPGALIEALTLSDPDAEILLAGNTAMQFGRMSRDRHILYVVTNGGLTGLVNGTAIEGGRVIALDLSKGMGPIWP